MEADAEAAISEAEGFDFKTVEAEAEAEMGQSTLGVLETRCRRQQQRKCGISRQVHRQR